MLRYAVVFSYMQLGLIPTIPNSNFRSLRFHGTLLMNDAKVEKYGIDKAL